jgi:signal transduction histidine kinase
MNEELLFGRVLLLEDDPSHALLIKRALRGLVGEIREAGATKAAFAALAQEKFALIIADLHLPDTQGVGHIGELWEKSAHTPVVVLTSSTSIEEAVAAMKLGACDFLVKNFDANFPQMINLALERIAQREKLSREREKLQREMAALRMAIENGSDGLAVLTAGGGVAYANSAFHEFVERCGGAATTLPLFFSAKVVKAQELLKAVEEKRKSLPVGAVWHTEATFEGEKGLAYGLSLSVIQRAENEQGNECVLWARNISEQKRREQFQREILSTTTHDLKGPLGAILLSADLAGSFVQENKKAAELILRIASSAQNALTLIDEFLSARRIQEGSFVLHPTLQKIDAIVREALLSFEPVAASRQITLRCEIYEVIEAKVDKLGLQRVVGNLVSNSLKFTPKGGMVTVSAFRNAEEVQLRVTDNGSGMEPGEVAKLFERFSRLDRHKEVAGTGLGLFVVRSIVTAHGGKIEVTSKLGQGTTFDITLPLDPPVNPKGELICLDFA